jgi:hypothetical protein
MSHSTPLPPPDHSVKVAHLVFALLFLGVATVWALVASDTIDADTVPLIGPAVLIAAGVVGLAASLANARFRRRHGVIGSESPDAYSVTYDDHLSGEDTDSEPTREIR